MLARSQINKEKSLVKTFRLDDLNVGDLVRFKGTRDKKGIRKIVRMSLYSYSCMVMAVKFNNASPLYVEQDYMSINGIDKLTHVLVQGDWVKVVQ